MNMNPWMVEQLVAGRRDDLERAAHVHSRTPSPDTEIELVARADAPRPRPAFGHHLGILLIAVGRRLTEGDALPPAFDGPHRH
jgi:hypothetical protein